ncbi:DNA phosphorothioation-associated putative methyltransferase [Spirulina sp. 06S082]|uniref:DNA phosphorothioation-associated putative methyltransferase n=1 Tax=Spirulina sp. 06S082 TaxID=3110248 RepID=UPI003A4DA4FD
MEIDRDRFTEIVQKCETSLIGKRLPTALYVHTSALSALDRILQDYEDYARQASKQIQGATLIKFNTEQPKLSYLFYPDFDIDPHPALSASIQVDLNTLTANYRDYSHSENPPILHRKETFVTTNYPFYKQFRQLTCIEERLGLLDKSGFIGTRREWLQKLHRRGVHISGHEVIQKKDNIILTPDNLTPRIDRHKAAIVRKHLSRPVRTALEAELFTPETTFFDYGCGHGGDIERIAKQGYESSGWDPYYCPNMPLISADIVNLGYIINVIEDLAERREALIKAWELTQTVLIVSAQVLIRDKLDGQIAYEDGIITRRNTFQKYYEQEELKTYIDQVLEVNSIPVALGIYFVFRDETKAEIFRESRFRSRATTPRITVKVRRFEDYAEMLAPLMVFITERGRLPVKKELKEEEEILAEFKTYRRAFQLILQATDEEEWEAIAEKRRQDMKVYLALTHFTHRLTSRKLTRQAREDFKALFGSYKHACLLADMMLLTVGDLENIADICQESFVGKKYKNSFLVHISVLEKLDPLLRLYEGCASRTIGRLESVTVIKFHLNAPKISYLYYPDFDTEPHPALETTMQIDLRDLEVKYWECDRDNPSILHEKEQLITPDYPNYEKFAKLSQQERDWGLLEERNLVRKRQDWLKLLRDRCVTLKNYRLYWRKDADPYKLKALRAEVARRKQKRKRKKD